MSSQPEAVSARELDQLLALQQDILEQIALGIEIQSALDQLCLWAERLVPDSLASVMLLDNLSDALYVKSAPSIPEAVRLMLDGLKPGPLAGSCGCAVHEEQAVFVCDTRHDMRWGNLQHIASAFGIAACWSIPIRTSCNRVAGSFAISSLSPREPSAFQKRLLEVAAHIAGIAIARKEAENHLAHQAYHDLLTDLPNRRLLLDRIEHALAYSRTHKTRGALVFIDLDRFKNINDSHGHATGDTLLSQVARRIAQSIDEDITLARLGGDEFVLLIENIEHDRDVSHICQHVLDELKKPFRVDHHEFFIMASAGICLYPLDGHTPGLLLSHADSAMYEAKSRGRSQFCYYTPEMTTHAQNELNLENDMRRALRQEQFTVYYQPQVCSNKGTITGMEALLRWEHPEKGFISPELFIPVAEETGLINEIGEWVTHQACQQLAKWHANGHRGLQMAINLSGRQLDLHHIHNLEKILRSSGAPASHIEFELTETYVMKQAEKGAALLERIRAMGASLAVDDFGIGYSSLAYLKRLPINKLKIDRSLVRDIGIDANDKAITRAVIGLGRSLGLKVLAEGVENDAQRQFLFEEGCDYLQGFLFGKPTHPDLMSASQPA